MNLRLLNDPILREVSTLVEEQELSYINSLVPEMTLIMNKVNGVGLAANQVGILKRFFILKDENTIKLFINPEILEQGANVSFTEGCLSIPGVTAETQRSEELTLRFRDENYVENTKKYNNIMAIAIQHEIDHLNGVLYIDRLSFIKKTLVLNKYLKYRGNK